MNPYIIPGLSHTIEQVVADIWRVPLDMLTERTREREIVDARQVCMWWLVNNTVLTHKFIAKRLGGFNHATVTHAVKTVENMIDTNRNYRAKVEEIVSAARMLNLS